MLMGSDHVPGTMALLMGRTGKVAPPQRANILIGERQTISSDMPATLCSAPPGGQALCREL